MKSLSLTSPPRLKSGSCEPARLRTSTIGAPSQRFKRLPACRRRTIASDLLNAYLSIRKAFEELASEAKTVREMIALASCRQEVDRAIDIWRQSLHAAQKELRS